MGGKVQSFQYQSKNTSMDIYQRFRSKANATHFTHKLLTAFTFDPSHLAFSVTSSARCVFSAFSSALKAV